MSVAEQACPRCHTSTYHKPKLRLLVNVCGHKLCDACVDAVFTRPTAPCPECGKALRRNQYRLQQFEDSNVEKEVDIRKRILKDYNKREEDFPTLREYNNYLEDVEVIIFNLTYEVDVDETRLKVEEYRKNNQSLIQKNKARAAREEHVLSTQLQLEQMESEERRRRVAEMEDEISKSKQKAKEFLIDQLMNTDQSANDVIASCMQAQSARGPPGLEAKRESGPLFAANQVGQVVFEPLPDMEVDDLFCYEPLTLPTDGPSVPSTEAIQKQGYVNSVPPLDPSTTGGGFTPALSCRKLLEEAYSCLFLSNTDPMRLRSTHA